MKKWMKRGAIALLALALVCAAAGGLSRPGAAATAQKEFRGMWAATVYNLDYPSRGTTDPQTLKKQANTMISYIACSFILTVVKSIKLPMSVINYTMMIKLF